MSNSDLNLLTLQQVLDIFGISRSTIDRWRKNRLLPFIKIGKEIYFQKDELESWVRSRRQIFEPDHDNQTEFAVHNSRDKHTITIGYQSGTAHMWSPIIIKELCLLEEELNGIEPSHAYEIRWQNAANGMELVEQMISGHIHIASLGDYPIIKSHQLSQILPNFKPILLAFDGKTSQGKGISFIVSKKNEMIDHIENLSNITISTVLNSSAGHRLNQFLASKELKNFQVIHQEMKESLTNLLRRNIGASVMWEPYVSLIRSQNRGEIIFEEILGEDYLTGIVALDRWSQSYELVIIAYLKAHLRAHQFAREYPLKTARIISGATGFPLEVTMQILSNVRWDASVYLRDLETLKKLSGENSQIHSLNTNSGSKEIAYRGYYLNSAIQSMRLPAISNQPLTGEWSNVHLY